MKKLFLLPIFAFFATFAFAQNTSAPKFTVQGGLWAGTNKTTTFVGFIGPKFSFTTPLTSKCKMEIGINGVPGLMVRPEIKLGLSAGGTITFKFENWKFKPVFGVMFVKTIEWQPMVGVGFVL